MNNKLKYLLHSLAHYSQKPVCPYCKNTTYKIVDRKYIVTRLVECTTCHLYYRCPRDTKEFSIQFYQDDYVETGITTDLPSPEELQKLKETNFANAEKNFQPVIQLLQVVMKNNPSIKIVDYGTSWGYASYQFKNAGMQVQSSEISAPRAKFGNTHLGLNIRTNENDLLPGNDIFFSAHVIEHHPDISEMVSVAKKLLVPEGFFVAFCPNASDAFRKKDPYAFHHFWGLVHPNYLGDKFFRHIFSGHPYFIGSNPYNYEQLQAWDQRSQFVGDLSGSEIFVITRPNFAIKN